MKPKKNEMIVLTGGAGFIGSHVIRELNARGYSKIVIFDDLGKKEKWKNLIGKTFYDILPKQTCFDWLNQHGSKVFAIIHLGACSSTTETDAQYLLENNYHYSKKLVQLALPHKIRFIYASSAATYGDGQNGFSDDENGLESLRPLNMYGMSKHLFDLWLKNEGLLDQVAGLKYFNVFGPNEGHKGRMASVVYHLTPAILKEKIVRLFQSSEPEKYSNGNQMRDFIYVDDAARMTCAFLECSSGGIFNIGTGQPATWNALAAHIFSALNISPKIEYIPMPADLIGKYQNYSSAGNLLKTKAAIGQDLNFTPHQQAIKQYVCNYLIPGRTC